MTETVRIPGPMGPLEAALIAVPGAAHVVVIVPGSGPTDRDGNQPATGLVATDSYKLLAEGVAAAGIASLRIDKRGMYGSRAAIPDANDVSVTAYADDLRGWIGLAATLAPSVWVAGHSEGGLVGLVAARDAPPALSGLILLAAPGRPVGDVLIGQIEANPANGPIMADVRAIVADLQAGRRRTPESMPEDLRPLFHPVVQGYWSDLLSHDPAAIARDWSGPVLIIQGDADTQVTLADADHLAAAMPQARRIDLAGGTHTLKAAVEGAPLATYQDPTLPLHPDLVPGIVAFLTSAR
jgi:pimeloyl-ACP methyl ester carboxylesterase